MRSGGIETVAIANGNHRFSKLAYDFEIPLKDLVQKTQGLAFWQCRSCWLVALGCPHVRPLRCDFAQPMIYIPSWRPLALGPLVSKGDVFSVYSSGHHISHTSSSHTHSPSPAASAMYDPTPTTHPDQHPPHPKPSPNQSSTITPPNPRPPLHPIPDHHSTQSPTTTPAPSMIKVSQVREP